MISSSFSHPDGMESQNSNIRSPPELDKVSIEVDESRNLKSPVKTISEIPSKGNIKLEEKTEEIRSTNAITTVDSLDSNDSIVNTVRNVGPVQDASSEVPHNEISSQPDLIQSEKNNNATTQPIGSPRLSEEPFKWFDIDDTHDTDEQDKDESTFSICCSCWRTCPDWFQYIFLQFFITGILLVPVIVIYIVVHPQDSITIFPWQVSNVNTLCSCFFTISTVEIEFQISILSNLCL